MGQWVNVFQHRVTEIQSYTEKMQTMFIKYSSWYNSITERIIRCAIEVHKELGPGLVESVYEAQLVTYLKLSGKKLGLLINFNVVLLKDGIRRRINGNLNSA